MTGVSLIAKERQRQIDVENYNAEHDDDHGDGQMAMTAAALAVAGTSAGLVMQGYEDWGLVEHHKNDRVRQLVIAGALIAAEIDRLCRERLAHCPECDEVTAGYERGIETLAGIKYPGKNVKMEPCGCVTDVEHLPNPFVVGYDKVIPAL